MNTQYTNTMDNLILEAINYLSKKKVTEDSISTNLNNKRARNIDKKSIIEILKWLRGLINELYRPIDTAIKSKAPHSTPSQSAQGRIQNKSTYVSAEVTSAVVKLLKNTGIPIFSTKLFSSFLLPIEKIRTS